MQLDEKTINAVYDLLIAEAGASPDERKRRDVLAYLLTAKDFAEWRFMGHLGGGGKLHYNGNSLYVSCYLESETPERLAIIEKVNKKLTELTAHLTKKLWIWNWIGGGYNSCLAVTREDALKEASRIRGQTSLVVAEATLHVGTYEELEKLDRQYAD